MLATPGVADVIRASPLVVYAFQSTAGRAHGTHSQCRQKLVDVMSGSVQCLGSTVFPSLLSRTGSWSKSSGAGQVRGAVRQECERRVRVVTEAAPEHVMSHHDVKKPVARYVGSAEQAACFAVQTRTRT